MSMKMPAVTVIAVFAVTLVASASDSEPAWRTDVASPRIKLLEEELKRGDSKALASFWAEINAHGAPQIEALANDPNHVLLTFLHRGNAQTKSVVLDAQLTKTRDETLNLTRLLQTDVWYKTFLARNDLRFSYSLNSAADPLNPKTLPAGVSLGPSFVELPKALPQPWISPKAGTPRGLVTEAEFPSKILNAKRSAWIYAPPGYDAKRAAPYPVLICFDGSLYASDDAIATPAILDNLIAAGDIPPVIGIFVAQSPQPQRNLELSNNGPFADFVANELLPLARKQWRITSSPNQTILCGSSAGGLASLFLAFRHPDVFGNVLAQSAALWPGQERDNPQHEWLTRQYESSPKLPIRIVLQPGVLEVGQTPLNGPSILDSNRHLRDVLTAKGYRLYYSEVPGGHEALTWRGGIAPGLIQLLGKGN
jgi:enterochelin esterase-like enzyme